MGTDVDSGVPRGRVQLFQRSNPHRLAQIVAHAAKLAGSENRVAVASKHLECTLARPHWNGAGIRSRIPPGDRTEQARCDEYRRRNPATRKIGDRVFESANVGVIESDSGATTRRDARV